MALPNRHSHVTLVQHQNSPLLQAHITKAMFSQTMKCNQTSVSFSAWSWTNFYECVRKNAKGHCTLCNIVRCHHLSQGKPVLEQCPPASSAGSFFSILVTFVVVFWRIIASCLINIIYFAICQPGIPIFVTHYILQRYKMTLPPCRRQTQCVNQSWIWDSPAHSMLGS